MGVVIPQVVTEDRASGAQVIDGGLVFDGGSTQYLEKTFASEGNRQSWTWSGWVKKQKITNDRMVLFGGYSAGSDTGWIELGYDDDKFYYTQNSVAGQSTEVFRDSTGWHHVVINYNGSNVVFYSNGEQIYSVSKTGDLGINSAGTHRIGRSPSGNTRYFYGQITNSYFIDGQALTPSNFGFTDGLTNTWRPKKYSGTFGANGFYLPMDGNTPIGFDESGNGNDFTPVNLSGSVGLDKATGALPILNTNGGGSIANAGVRTDAYAANLVLALPLVGGVTTDLSNSINSTTTAKTITKNGDPSTVTSSSNFYGDSLDFDASGDYLSSSSSTDFAFGTGDFTIEYWANYDDVSTASQKGDFQTSDASGGLKTTYTTGILASFGSSNGLYRVNINSSNVLTASGYTTGVWYHNAITREGSTIRLFRNGILQATASNSTNFSSSTYLAVGGYYSTSYLMNGRLQDFRIYKGVAKYTSNFLVGSASPDILPDTPSGVATKTALTKITNGAVAFDRTDDYLKTTLSSADFTMGTGDFTVECYVYIKGSNQVGIFQISDTSGGLKTGSYGSTIALGAIPGSSSYWQIYGAGTATNGFSNMSVNRWHHVAYVRSSGTSKLYVDGTSIISQSDTTDYDGTYIAVGGYYSTSYLMDGLISNFRVIKGTALYTSNFTPPTEPLTNVTNTKLLCCNSNRDQVDASVSPQINSTINAGTPWSFFTDGTIFANRPKYNLYDGSTSTFMAPGTSGVAGISNVTLSIPGDGISDVTSVRVYVGSNQVNNSPTVTLNSDSAQAISATNQYVTLTNPTSGTLNTITFTGNATSSSNNLVEFAAIEVNGTVLKDPINWNGEGDNVATTFNPFNTDVNTIRGQETNYATLNLLDQNGSSTISNGNLDMGNSQGSSAWGTVRATIGASSGKFYAEYTCTASSGGFRQTVGVVSLEVPNGTSVGSNVALNNLSDSAAYFNNGQKSLNGSTSSYGAAWTAGDVVGIALDVDETSVTFFVNGVSQGVASSALASDAALTFGGGMISSNETGTWNFGQKPFKFTPPDGFQPMTGSTLRPEKVVPDPDQYFDALTYTGTGATQTFNTLNFGPDLVWIKRISSGTASHVLNDTVRGAGKQLRSDTTDGESTNTNNFAAFTSDGFTIGTGSGTNSNTNTHVAWTWRAGGSKNTFNIDDVGYASAAAAGLDGGSTNPTGASVNTKSKFGIYTFDGNSSNRTMSHGLGQQPDFMICKKKSADGNSWVVWHKGLDNTKYQLLNSGSSQGTDSTLFNSHASDSSTLWTLGSNTTFNESGQSSVAYLWCDVPGLQKFGTYQGNSSSTNGPFIELGFRPALFVMKQIDAGGYWMVYDSARDTTNDGSPYYLFWNDSAAHGTGYDLDFLSNGVKLRTNNANFNTTSYMYMAWAEAPSFNMYGASSNAL